MCCIQALTNAMQIHAFDRLSTTTEIRTNLKNTMEPYRSQLALSSSPNTCIKYKDSRSKWKPTPSVDTPAFQTESLKKKAITNSPLFEKKIVPNLQGPNPWGSDLKNKFRIHQIIMIVKLFVTPNRSHNAKQHIQNTRRPRSNFWSSTAK